MSGRKISIEAIAREPWGAAWLREFDLVIAANELDSMRTGGTLYNSVFEPRLGDLLASFDPVAVDECLGVIEVPDGPDHRFSHRVDEAVEPLRATPRGTWAVLRMDAGHDAYMSDGFGGVATASGHKFQHASPHGFGLDHRTLRGHVLSGLSYHRRNAMVEEIRHASYLAAHLEPGRIARAVRVNGKEWSKVELVSIAPSEHRGQPDVMTLKMTRPGVKSVGATAPVTSAPSLFSLPPVMPAAYAEAEGSELLEGT